MAFVANEGVAPKGDRYDRSALVNDTEGKLYKRTEFGDFIYSSNNLETGSIGLNKYGNATISPVYSIFRPTGIADSDFIGRRFIRKDFINEMVKWRQGVIYGQWKIHEEDFLKIEVMVPSLEEQRLIGSFLDNLDHLITLHQYKLYMGVYRKGTILTYFWEQRKVGDCFLSLQNNTLSRAELSDENGTVMNVHYGDVLTKFSECLDVSKDRLPFIKKQFFMDKFKTSYLKNGDVIVSDTAEDETVGKCIEIIGMTNQKVLSGLHTIPLRPKEQFATGYLGFYLNSSAYHRQLKPLMQGIKVTSISKSAMLDTVIKYPSDIWEQTLIGQYFMSLDNLITLHQRKIKYILKEVFIWIILIKRVVLKKPLSLNYRIMVGRKKLLSILQNRI